MTRVLGGRVSNLGRQSSETFSTSLDVVWIVLRQIGRIICRCNLDVKLIGSTGSGLQDLLPSADVSTQARRSRTHSIH